VAVDYTRDGEVALIHLDRPERLNAVVPALTDGLAAGLRRAAAEGARAVVLAGRGRSFCAGHDLKEPEPVESPLETRARLVHGHALGAGCEFALACDVVVATADAQFGFPEVEVGLSVTGGISRLLPALVGWARAKELMLLGERITGARAGEIGMVARVVPPGEHETAALGIAHRVCARPALSVSLAKRVLDEGLDASFEEALGREVDHALLTSLSGEGDAPREAFGRG
jgi:enoyl-CoA hydratase/carnithine racemase